MGSAQAPFPRAPYSEVRPRHAKSLPAATELEHVFQSATHLRRRPHTRGAYRSADRYESRRQSGGASPRGRGVGGLVPRPAQSFPSPPWPSITHAVNDTTLRYGDVVMTASWNFLGPLEAANGMLLFGGRRRWSLWSFNASLRPDLPISRHDDHIGSRESPWRAHADRRRADPAAARRRRHRRSVHESRRRRRHAGAAVSR